MFVPVIRVNQPRSRVPDRARIGLENDDMPSAHRLQAQYRCQAACHGDYMP